MALVPGQAGAGLVVVLVVLSPGLRHRGEVLEPEEETDGDRRQEDQAASDHLLSRGGSLGG